MFYRNSKTGAILSTDCELGGVWVVFDPNQVPDKPGDDMPSTAEIKSRLDELGVTYDKKAKKAELWALLQEQE